MRKTLSKIKALFEFLIIINSSIVFGQINNLTPNTPNATELGKYGLIPIGQFTGTVQFTVPIYEIKLSELILSINANYSSNGVKIDKYESDLGIDWSLQAGGVINRILKGNTDENNRLPFPQPPYQETNDVRLVTLYNNLINSDIEPDLFVFNLNGTSGKFFLDENLNPKLVEQSDFKIQYLQNDLNSDRFIITSPTGDKYYFGANNGTEKSFSRTFQINNSSPAPPTDYYEVSWYLSKIITANNEQINFYYGKKNITRLSGISQTLSAKFQQNYSLDIFSPPYLTRTYFDESQLNKIEWTTGKIEIERTNFINSLKIANNNNEIIKKINFIYDDFPANSSFQNPNCSTCGLNTLRSFIKKIVFLNRNNDNSNEYLFEYYNPYNLPPRFSYARDNWGYFNGKTNSYLINSDVSNFNQNDYSSSASNKFNYNVIQNLFSTLNANKSPVPEFNINGLLKKVHYPTKGYTEFIYEPHSVYKEVENLTYSTINLSTNTISTFNSQTNLNFISKKNHFVYLRGSLSFINSNSSEFNCVLSEYPTHWIRGSISILDETTNSLVNFYQSAVGQDVLLGTNYTIINQNIIPTNSIKFYLEKNHTYSIILKLSKPCLQMNVGFDYVSNIVSELRNVPVGGMRIKKINNYFDVNNVLVEEYKYGNDSCLDCSSGIMETLKPGISFSEFNSNEPGSYAEYYCNLTSNSMNENYFNESYHIGYSNVYKFYKSLSENGFEKNNYKIVFGNTPSIILGDYIPGTNYSNGFGHGDLILTTYFNSQYKKIKEILYEYDEKSSDDYKIYGYNLTLQSKVSLLNFNQTLPINYYKFNLNKYSINSKFKYLKRKETRNYFYDSNQVDSKLIKDIEEYKYDGFNHKQITNLINILSNNDYKEKQFSYANDLGIFNLINKNLKSVPLTTKIFKNSELITKNEVQYSDFGNNLILPKFIKSVKGSNTLETNVEFVNYDEFGHPREVKQVNGMSITYLYGYNKSLPIAKIENATYAQVQQYEANLQALSNGTDENALITALNNLRSALPKAMVSTYTHKPLIGISTATDPKGDKQTYHYDSFNRLQFVKDKEGNILSENEYHYKN